MRAAAPTRLALPQPETARERAADARSRSARACASAAAAALALASAAAFAFASASALAFALALRTACLRSFSARSAFWWLSAACSALVARSSSQAAGIVAPAASMPEPSDNIGGAAITATVAVSAAPALIRIGKGM